MKIEKNSLVVMVNGVKKTVKLPTVTSDAKVKAWAVPAGYRADGLFVAVTQRGDAEEIPACDLAACEFLGELEMEADADARLQAAKVAKLTEINAACEAAASALAASYPESEVKSWPQQVKEAEALAINAKASAPLLSAIATERAMPLAVLAAKVLEKMAAYAAVSGAIIGRRQKIEALIDAAKTMDEVAAIHW